MSTTEEHVERMMFSIRNIQANTDADTMYIYNTQYYRANSRLFKEIKLAFIEKGYYLTIIRKGNQIKVQRI